MKAALKALVILLPTALAVRLVLALVAVAKRMPLKPRDREALARADAVRWGPTRKHQAYAWGDGPLVLLVHGWGGGAAQMAPLAEHLAWLGFRAVAPDLSGHGASPGRRISFAGMASDLRDLPSVLGDPVAVIGHSAGAMTMMAARQSGALTAQCWAGLNAPLYPYPPITAIKKAINPPERILQPCQDAFCAQFGLDTKAAKAGALYADGDDAPLLLVHDADDDQVRASDGQAISAQWPTAICRTTQDLGHHKTLWDEATVIAVGDFVSANVHAHSGDKGARAA